MPNVALTRGNRQIPRLFGIKAGIIQMDVRHGIYPTIFSENIFVAMIALAFKLLWSGAKMTGTET